MRLCTFERVRNLCVQENIRAELNELRNGQLRQRAKDEDVCQDKIGVDA